MCIVKCIFSDQIISMVHIPFKEALLHLILGVVLGQDGLQSVPLLLLCFLHL